MASRKAGIGGKMERAALDIFAERGTLQITAAEIAARAGTTERTFFRHFPDKLDVFFGDESRLRDRVAEAILACPHDMSALSAAITGLAALATDFEANQEAIRNRGAAIAAHPDLQAREMARTAPWIAQIKTSLRQRGAAANEVDRAAPLALITFRVAYEQWIADPGGDAFDHRLIAVLEAIGRDITQAGRQLG
jgi:AcrR family transcriptional regulator